MYTHRHTFLHAEMSSAACAPHAVVVALPAQGHINPLDSIAHILAAAGIVVTFAHISSNYSLLSSSAAAVGGLIRIVPIPDVSPSATVKPGYTTVDSVMCKGMEQLLHKLMQEKNPPCCLIADGLLPWCHDLARKFALPIVAEWPTSSSALSVGLHLPELLARGYIPARDHESNEQRKLEFIPGLSCLCMEDLPPGIKAEGGLPNADFEFLSCAFENMKTADRILVNTIYELESDVLENLRTEFSVCMCPISPLHMLRPAQSTHASLLEEDNDCLTWLSQQPQMSVVYVSLGSITTLEEDELKELAHGLEASGERFLWVIRPDERKAKGNTTADGGPLPAGFMTRTRDRGLVISWAPQVAVLGHPCVGAFVTHCGWNSVIESLSNGVPMLSLGHQLPRDHRLNHKVVVNHLGVGLPLLPAHAAKVERAYVQGAVNAMMKGVQGTKVRKRALECKEAAHKACHGTAKANFQKLVDDLKRWAVETRANKGA